MSYNLNNPQGLRHGAFVRYGWGQAQKLLDGFSRLFGADDPVTARLNNRVVFNHQALVMLNQLNEYDRKQVLKEVVELTYNPFPPAAVRNRLNPLRALMRSRYPFNNYHYLISYSIAPDGRSVLVEDFLFDQLLVGAKTAQRYERNMMYDVRRVPGAGQYRNPLVPDDVKKLVDSSWNVGEPIPRIAGRYAAVNGMQNDLTKAGWLMGTHLDVAFPESNIDRFTLFHNPTEGERRDRWVMDVAECLWDKTGLPPSSNAQHLAAVLRQRQQLGEQTDWVVHSQGAIIFANAVRFHLARYPAQALSKHRVAFHSGGATLAKVRGILVQAQIAIAQERINPYDMVPNLGGGHNLSPSSLLRCWRFRGLVQGDNGGNVAVSPHTLPYLGIRSYYDQLRLAGFHREAAQVGRDMARMDERQRAYEAELSRTNQTLFNGGRSC